MERAKILKKKIPDSPGVYFFMGKRRTILYIGRATSLDKRVKSYFDPKIKEKRSALIERMVKEAMTVEWQVTDSVLEAILLEVNLIRTHKPEYNTISKDDKSYNHVAITDEKIPRVLVLRGKDLREEGEGKYRSIFGPFPSGKLLRDALKIIQRIFHFYDISKSVTGRLSKIERGKIAFNRQIGLYPGDEEREEYLRTVQKLELFFQGKKDELLKGLRRDMTRYAKEEEFEEADKVKRNIQALEHIQDVSLLRDDYREYRDDRSFRIEGYDIAHHGGKDMVGVMTVLEAGIPKTSEYRTFTIRNFTDAHDPGALHEVVSRRVKHREWALPSLIVGDGNAIQKRAIERALKEEGLTIPVVTVLKDEHHKPKGIVGAETYIEKYKEEILLINAESHRFAIGTHRRKRRKHFLPGKTVA